jgi:hypothetical protein
VARGEPALQLLALVIDHEQRVGGADLGVADIAEALRQLPAELVPGVVLLGREERHLARSGRGGVAVEGDAGAVGPALGELAEHRAQMRTESLLNGA